MRNVERILIIEDEVEIAELEKDYLELSGFEVDLESNGKSGCSRALAGDYDLLILDLMLPDMDGFDICKAVRGKKNIPTPYSRSPPISIPMFFATLLKNL